MNNNNKENISTELTPGVLSNLLSDNNQYDENTVFVLQVYDKELRVTGKGVELLFLGLSCGQEYTANSFISTKTNIEKFDTITFTKKDFVAKVKGNSTVYQIKNIQVLKSNNYILGDPLRLYSQASKMKNENNTNKKNNNNNNNTNNNSNNSNNKPKPSELNKINWKDIKNNTNKSKSSKNKDELDRYTTLKEITNFTQDGFIVLLRVTSKSELKTFQNQKGNGTLFSMTLHDSDGTEQDMAIFNADADKYFNVFIVDHVYEFINPYRRINPKKNKIGSSDYVISPGRSGEIVDVTNEKSHLIVQDCFNFLDLETIKTLGDSHEIDTVAIVIKAYDKKTYQRKTDNTDFHIRELIIGDKSGYKITFKIFNEPDNTNFNLGDVLVLKGAKIDIYQERMSLKLQNFKSLIWGKEKMHLTSVQEQYAYYKQNNDESKYTWISSGSGNSDGNQRDNITYIKDMVIKVNELRELDDNTKLPFFKVRARPIRFYLEDNSIYPACPKCKKKVSEQSSESEVYDCMKEGCNFTGDANWTWKVSFALVDTSGSFVANILGDQFDSVIDCTAKEYYNNVVKSKNVDVKNYIEKNAMFKFFDFLIKPSIEAYNDKVTVKYRAVNIQEIEIKAESKTVMKLLSNVYINTGIKSPDEV